MTCALVVSLAEAQEGTNVYDKNWVSLKLDPADPTKCVFKVRMLKNTWLGLGLGAKGMAADTDMIQIDGENQKVFDMTSVGF